MRALWTAFMILAVIGPGLLFPPLGLAAIGLVVLRQVFAWIDGGTSSGGPYQGD